MVDIDVEKESMEVYKKTVIENYNSFCNNLRDQAKMLGIPAPLHIPFSLGNYYLQDYIPYSNEDTNHLCECIVNALQPQQSLFNRIIRAFNKSSIK